MMWLGLVGGIVGGGLIWGIEGAVVLGFLGWLAGLIIQSNRAARGPAAKPPGPEPKQPGPGTGQVLVPGVGQVLVPGLGQVLEAELNPVIVRAEGQGVVAVDAVVRTA